MARRLGSAMTSKTDSTLLIYFSAHIPVKEYMHTKEKLFRGSNTMGHSGCGSTVGWRRSGERVCWQADVNRPQSAFRL